MEYNTLESAPAAGAIGIVHDLGSLYDRFQHLSDPRKAQGKRYNLVTLLVIIFLAKLGGRDRPEEIADLEKNHATELVQMLRLKRNWMPHHNTIRRVFHSILAEDEFNQMAQAYSQQAPMPEGQVLAQLPVDIKENEIVVAPQLLAQVDLTGKIVTGDALHTQRAISAQIVRRNGDYVWPVKENQLRLYEDLQRLFAPDPPRPGSGKIATDFLVATHVNGGHGRLEKRIIQTSAMLNEYLDWPGLTQVYRLERKFEWRRLGHVYKSSHEVEVGITSLSRDRVSPAQLLHIRRQHWFVETGLHYRRDVTFYEDATRMTIGAAGRILAMVHNLIIGLIKRAGYQNAAQARRYYDGHINEAFQLLLTAHDHS